MTAPWVIDPARTPDTYDPYRDLELRHVRRRSGWLASRHGDGTLTAYRDYDNLELGPDTPARLLQAMAAADDALRAPLARFLPVWSVAWMSGHGAWLAMRRNDSLTISKSGSSRRRVAVWAPSIEELCEALSGQADADADEIVEQSGDDLDAADAADRIGRTGFGRSTFGGDMGELGDGSGEPPGADPDADPAAAINADDDADDIEFGEDVDGDHDQSRPVVRETGDGSGVPRVELFDSMLAKLAGFPETMTLHEVAVFLQVNPRAVTQWGEAGWGGMFRPPGGTPRFRRDQIIANSVVVGTMPPPAPREPQPRGPDGRFVRPGTEPAANTTADGADTPGSVTDSAIEPGSGPADTGSVAGTSTDWQVAGQDATEPSGPALGGPTGLPPGRNSERGEASS